MNEKEYQEYQSKKEYLTGYRTACKRIENLKEQLESLWEIEQSIKSQQMSDMPKGSSRHQDLSDLMVKLEDLQERIDDAITESCRIKLEESRVLRYRYIYFIRCSEISKIMNYSRTQVWRIHDKAIKNLKMKHSETF